MKNLIFNTLEEVVKICENDDIKYWVVGGFAVDAKKGYLSREHGDIDLCIHQHDMNKCLKTFYKSGFTIMRKGLKYVFYKSNIKIDIFELIVGKDCYKRKREWFKAKYPKEMFDNFQFLELNNLKFRIPSNEGIRYYGSKTSHTEDTVFTNGLPFNEKIYSKLEYNEFADYEESKKGIKVEELSF